MSKARFFIVRRPEAESTPPYLGMDREPFGSDPQVAEAMIMEGMALLDIPDEQAEVSYCEFWEKLHAEGYDQYDLLALEIQPGDDWEFLGYDVGEKTARCWSVVAHWRDFLKPPTIHTWEEMLNSNGLFADPNKAKALLATYLDSGDPDMGWTDHGWDEQADLYAVIPVYRYRRPP